MKAKNSNPIKKTIVIIDGASPEGAAKVLAEAARVRNATKKVVDARVTKSQHPNKVRIEVIFDQSRMNSPAWMRAYIDFRNGDYAIHTLTGPHLWGTNYAKCSVDAHNGVYYVPPRKWSLDMVKACKRRSAVTGVARVTPSGRGALGRWVVMTDGANYHLMQASYVDRLFPAGVYPYRWYQMFQRLCLKAQQAR